MKIENKVVKINISINYLIQSKVIPLNAEKNYQSRLSIYTGVDIVRVLKSSSLGFTKSTLRFVCHFFFFSTSYGYAIELPKHLD